jgi:hypothetical protein
MIVEFKLRKHAQDAKKNIHSCAKQATKAVNILALQHYHVDINAKEFVKIVHKKISIDFVFTNMNRFCHTLIDALGNVENVR